MSALVRGLQRMIMHHKLRHEVSEVRFGGGLHGEDLWLRHIRQFGEHHAELADFVDLAAFPGVEGETGFPEGGVPADSKQQKKRGNHADQLAHE